MLHEFIPDPDYESMSWSNDRELFIENCRIRDLAKEFGTPLYVISEKQLLNNARLYKKVFSDRWKEGSVRITPAIKANFTLATRKILTMEGCGCDVFSQGELWAALQSGIDPELISLNGNGKLGANNTILEEAITAGARITIDQVEELDIIEMFAKNLKKKVKIRFRLRPEFAELRMPTQYLSGLQIPIEYANIMYKHGIPLEALIPLGKRALESPHLDLIGVHIHLGRHRRDPAYWGSIIKGYVRLLSILKVEWGGWEPLEIDIGGGIPSRRDPHCGTNVMEENLPASQPFEDVVNGKLKGPELYKKIQKFNSTLRHLYRNYHMQDPLMPLRLPLEVFAEVITDTLRKELTSHGLEPKGKILEIEPGRGLYADAGIHIAKVTVLKKQIKPVLWNWLNIDTAQSFLGNLVTEHALYRYLIDGKPRSSWTKTITADIVGCSCNLDRLISDAVIPQETSPNDLIVFLDTGAYEDSNTSNFNALPRPATVLVSDKHSAVIKKRETIKDVFRRDIIPEHLV